MCCRGCQNYLERYFRSGYFTSLCQSHCASHGIQMSDPEYAAKLELTVGGSDVVRDVERVELQDLEDAVSTIMVTLINDMGKYSGKFKDGDKIVGRFGMGSDWGDKFTLTVHKIDEIYSHKGLRAIVTGYD